MNKHTPGPWRVGEYSSGTEITADTGQTVCFLAVDRHDDTPTATISRANARLIAAAPKLLEAVRLFMAQYDIPGDRERANRPEIRAAHEALAQVEGRP